MLVHGNHQYKRLEIGKLHFHVSKGVFQIGWNGNHRYTHKIRIEVS